MGREFDIQGIRFLGVEECRPCYWMNRAFRREQAGTWLKGNGGLRARILTDGVWRRGDQERGQPGPRVRRRPLEFHTLALDRG